MPARPLLAESGMDAKELHRRETEALIEAIWGSQTTHAPPPPEPDARAAQNRAMQNRALAAAMQAYLQQYLSDAAAPQSRSRAGPPDESRKTR